VAYLLKAKTMLPEKQPLLANGCETTFVSRQLLGKHVLAAMDTYATIEVILETVFYTRSVQMGYKEQKWGIPCGGRIEYLHRSPVIRRRRQNGGLEFEIVKYGLRVPRVSDPRMTALARASSNCKRQTRPLV
jgi:hypothetical protein